MKVIKAVVFGLKLMLAITFIFVLSILQHGIGGINNQSFEFRVKKAKDTVYVLEFFKSWTGESKGHFPISPKQDFTKAKRPIKYIFITLDEKEKLFYSTIPYLIIHGITEESYFINNGESANNGYSLIQLTTAPGKWITFNGKENTIQIRRLENASDIEKYINDK